MKALIKDYVFDPNLGTITLSKAVGLESLLVITNVTRNTILYNFADPLKGCTVVDTVITLETSTSGMLNTDTLQVFIDEPNTDFESLAQDINDGLSEMVHLMKAQRFTIPDNAGRTRVNMETGGTIGTVTTVTTVGTVSNQTAMGGLQPTNMVMALTNAGAQNLRRGIGVS